MELGLETQSWTMAVVTSPVLNLTTDTRGSWGENPHNGSLVCVVRSYHARAAKWMP